ncbi:MAG: DUF885 domain-containing protein [Candidatus Heimdallarchaeota archaeon]|nr:MAG: DUF885 domain-containing protein [Candidatus Heimdallarchaeota archaeon]
MKVWASYYPYQAFGMGWREFAGQIPHPSLGRIQAYRHFLITTLEALESINFNELTKTSMIDFLVLQTKISTDLFHIDDLNSYTSNPLAYVDPAFIFEYLIKQYAPLSQRIEELNYHLVQLADFYSMAIKNLQWRNCAQEHAQMTLKMLQGMIPFLENIEKEVNDLESENNRIGIAVLENLSNNKLIAIGAITQFMDEIKTRLPEMKASYRLGDALFSKMLKTNERVDIPLEEILEAGEANLEHNLAELRKAASLIDPNRSIDEIIKEIRQDHPLAESLMTETSKMLKELRQFLIESNFVSIPSEVMPQVTETPKPFRPFALAMMDTPGPLEKKATDSYYYISPPESEWTEQEKEEWLETFNYRGLLDISAHEAFPGHYLHHLHNQRSKSLMSKLFGVYHFWEGYALYVEEALWQIGFQKGNYKYRIAQLFETLLRDVRLIVAIKLHTDESFTLEAAIQMFMKDAFLGRKVAETEAERATFDPGYLNYALGKLLVEKLLIDYKEEKGHSFSLKSFHDELLSYGAPPIPILRRFMLQDDSKHAEIL